MRHNVNATFRGIHATMREHCPCIDPLLSAKHHECFPPIQSPCTPAPTTCQRPPRRPKKYHGSRCCLLGIPASPVLLLSPCPHVCDHQCSPRVLTFWSVVHHPLVRSHQYVFSFFYLAFPESDNYISQGADELTSKERGAFIGGAIVETLFFLISSVGYVLRGKHIYTDH